MPSYRLDIEYDGGDFHGWQVQPGRRTVQGEIERSLAILCREPVRVVGAGRTDAGVHALGQVASFEASGQDVRRLRRGLNALLPPDVHVHRLSEVAVDFSARASALSRHYRYRMSQRSSPLERRFEYRLRHAVDAARMQAAAACLQGEHDFTAFAARDRDATGRRCRVLEARVDAEGERVRFEIGADRFVYNLVRRLAGALVEVGRGRLSPEDFERILVQRDTSRGGPCLPAHGLVLLSVRYPARFEPGVDARPTDP